MGQSRHHTDVMAKPKVASAAATTEGLKVVLFDRRVYTIWYVAALHTFGGGNT